MIYLVNAPNPMLLLRLPDPMPAWHAITSALSPTPQVFCHLHRVDADVACRERLEAAFAGGPEFASYQLYDWREGGFVLMRGAST